MLLVDLAGGAFGQEDGKTSGLSVHVQESNISKARLHAELHMISVKTRCSRGQLSVPVNRGAIRLRDQANLDAPQPTFLIAYGQSLALTLANNHASSGLDREACRLSERRHSPSHVEIVSCGT
jgi:hypothetical protein